MELVCRRALSREDIAVAMDIRETVFIDEQNVPSELERDGRDDRCLHYVVLLDGIVVGTARVMPLNDLFKFQRVAVLPEARGVGIGAMLMQFMMEDLAQQSDANTKYFFLSSQVSAISFYERLGFEICSDEYLDAGIQHRDMKRATKI
ncbi:MAG: GNAT family N-acetyltransferase [Pseudomonadota bacterium]